MLNAYFFVLLQPKRRLMDFSIVSPVYHGEKMLDELVKRIHAAVSPLTTDYEIILVNDCSPDNSWERIKAICQEDKRVKGINLSRNFGQPYAITAGLTYAKGDYIAVIDCDLQHPPEKIVEMYRLWEQGYEIVEGVKSDRGRESGLHRFAAKSFYGI